MVNEGFRRGLGPQPHKDEEDEAEDVASGTDASFVHFYLRTLVRTRRWIILVIDEIMISLSSSRRSYYFTETLTLTSNSVLKCSEISPSIETDGKIFRKQSFPIFHKGWHLQRGFAFRLLSRGFSCVFLHCDCFSKSTRKRHCQLYQ